ncbi:MAG: glutathione S-transferase family protein [Alphaproteobacteria bacterium]|nr:glutathione S-transferase family protein [Alphaproteobacteria bacterium]
MMIDLYTDLTPNGFRASIILEEAELDYQTYRINLAEGDQNHPFFESLNPAKAIPVIVDHDGIGAQKLIIPQSGAIILYAAEKVGRLIPTDPMQRLITMRWFMQIATDIIPVSSWIYNHNNAMPEKSAKNAVWLDNRLNNALSVADKWLAENEFFADDLSVADFLLYPTFHFRRSVLEESKLFPNLRRWGDVMAKRPSVQKGMSVGDRVKPFSDITDSL